MLNNRIYRKYRMQAGMLKRARRIRGRRVKLKELNGIARWVRYPTLTGRIYNKGIARISVIGRWPRIRVLETVVIANVNGDAFLRYYKKAMRGDGRK